MLRKVLYILAVVLAGLISVVVSELLLTSVWLPNAPFAVTSNLFWLGLLPVEVVTVGIASLALWKIHRSNLTLYMPLYAVVFAAAHAAELNSFFNPAQDIALYLLAIATACVVWFLLLRRAFSSNTQANSTVT